MNKIASIVLNNFTNDSRVLKEAMTLSNKGYQVIVIALHDGDLPISEKKNGINVHRIKLISKFLPKNKVFQSIKYLELLIRVVAKYYKFNYLHCHDLNALPIGYCCKLMNHKAKLIYDAHEFETERSYSQGKFSHTLLVALEKFLIRKSSAVITVSQGIADEYSKRYKITLPYLVMNCPPTVIIEKHDLFRQRFDLKGDTIIFLYQGILDTGRGIEIMLEAFKKLNDPSKVLICMGYGPLVQKVIDASNISSSVLYQPSVPYNEILDYTSSADWGMIYIENVSPSYNYSLPNKMFECYMAGIPVIATPVHEISKLVKEYITGYILYDYSVNSLIDILKSIDKRSIFPFQNGVAQARTIYNWEKQEETLLSLYAKL